MNVYHLAWAYLSARYYGFPSRKLVVIGVTGTNGKSTVVWLLARILEHAGYRVAASSSIEFQLAEKRWTNTFKMTMPGRGYLQRFLRDAVRAACTHAILEVTSEGVRQHRHRFIDFAVSVFLNLSPEHIERHGSYAKYRKAKRDFFRRGKTLVLNTGFAEAPFFLQGVGKKRLVAFRAGAQAADVSLPQGSEEFFAENIVATPEGIAFTLRLRSGQAVHDIHIAVPISGQFNVENVLAAMAAASAAGVPVEAAIAALQRINGVPGRFERIPNERGIVIIVDYAHTPTALQSVYESVKAEAPTLTCVLGAAGGGRDAWKRAELGKLASQYCEKIFVADEDPYNEDPNKIRDMVMDGARAASYGAHITELADRREAIRKAILATSSGSAVVITGKGSEPWMMLAKGEKLAWDDRQVVREELQKLANSQ